MVVEGAVQQVYRAVPVGRVESPKALTSYVGSGYLGVAGAGQQRQKCKRSFHGSLLLQVDIINIAAHHDWQLALHAGANDISNHSDSVVHQFHSVNARSSRS